MKKHLLSLLLLAPVVAQADLITGGFQLDGNVFNWAPGGTASQSTTGFGGNAERAIDGYTNGNYGSNSVSHTDGVTPGSFWQVDLGGNRRIDEVVLWNRTDCCGDRLSNFNLSITDALNATVFSQNYYVGAGSVGVSETVPIPGNVSGKVVKVQYLGNGLNNTGEPSLSLAEVQVKRANANPYPNIALNKLTLMSSEAYGGVASRGVDGNIDGNWGGNSVTHTADFAGGPVFWEVDLNGDFGINDISLWNRSDCCGTRLSNFRVSVFDGAVETWGQDYFPGENNGSAGRVFSILEDSGGFFATGDRVRVSLINGVNGSLDVMGGGKDILSLAEVQVFGAAVPEPSAALALLGGFGMLMIFRRRNSL